MWMHSLERAAGPEPPKSSTTDPGFWRIASNLTKTNTARGIAWSCARRSGSSQAVADPSKPARYTHDSDTDVTTLVHRLHKAYSFWGRYGSLFRGKEWPRALRKAHELNRLFFTPQQNSFSSTGWDKRVQAREYRQGSWAAALFLPTDPPLYLNVVKAKVGPAESSMPAAMLSVWADGPVLLADEVAPVNEQLERVAISSTAGPHRPA